MLIFYSKMILGHENFSQKADMPRHILIFLILFEEGRLCAPPHLDVSFMERVQWKSPKY